MILKSTKGLPVNNSLETLDSEGHKPRGYKDAPTFSARVERASHQAVHTLPSLLLTTWVSTQLALEAEPQKERTWDTTLSTSRCPNSCIMLSKKASMAHTALSGNFSHQERQVQPQMTTWTPSLQVAEGRTRPHLG